jgi:hypothetical protein
MSVDLLHRLLVIAVLVLLALFLIHATFGWNP